MSGRVLCNTGPIRMIVDRLHVSTTDDAIVADFEKRLARGDWTERERSRIIAYALAVHHRNQRQYNDIMGGL